MTRIDLRYLIVVATFYVPGALMLIGSWMLGYSTAEVRHFIGGVGFFIGIFASSAAGVVLFSEGEPIWFEIGRRK